LSLAVGTGVFETLAGNTEVRFANEPKRPTVDSAGRALASSCVTHDNYEWTINDSCQDTVYQGIGRIGPASSIARNPATHRAVLVQPDGSVLNIHDGGTFNCLADTWFVLDNAGLPALEQPTERNATCGDAGAQQWIYRPAGDGGNIPNNVILRERPEDATDGVIASWLINNRGEIQTIPDGGTYLCLAYTNPVIWNVPYGDVPFVGIAQWRPVGTEPASCGPS
jgi:hypothetical protein